MEVQRLTDRADDADQWVQVERYVLRDEIEELGGATKASVRIKAEYNVLTRELRNARLVELVEHATTLD